MNHLVEDVLAMVDSIGRGSPVHVVGHDWGGAVGWSLAGRHPDRLASLTVLSTPHPRALAKALTTSDQLLRSWYVGAFQVPMVPEFLLTAQGGALLRWALERSGLPTEYATEYATALREPAAMRATINWYRAATRSPASARWLSRISVPTSYVWSDGDVALNRVAAEATASHVAGPYRFEILREASHWLPETRPEAVASVVLDRVRQTR
jgi:pimeloyl-ACP methyl ester carboxylesterase